MPDSGVANASINLLRLCKTAIVRAVDDDDSLVRALGQVTIIGTGLLGASLGLGLRASGFGGRIVGVGRRASTVEQARRLGCIDEATTHLGPAVAGSGLVVLATPLGAFADLFQQVADHDHPGLVVTDVGSTKQQVCADARRLLPDATRFVGCHPMAGSEQKGPDAARADLFAYKPCIVTPEADTDRHAIGVVKGLWRTMGMQLIEMTPSEHDRRTARISHLPHAVACLLVKVAAQHDALNVASTGFRDTTRVAGGDPSLWTDIFTSNRRELIDALDAFGREIKQLRQWLLDRDDENVLSLFTETKRRRDQWVAGLGPSPKRRASDNP